MSKRSSEDTRRLLGRLFGYVRDYRRTIGLALLCMLVHSVFRQYPIYATGLIVDKVIIGEENPKEVWDDNQKLLKKLRDHLGDYVQGEDVDAEALAAEIEEANLPDHRDDIARVRARFQKGAEEAVEMVAVATRLSKGESVDRAEVQGVLTRWRNLETVDTGSNASRLRWLLLLSVSIFISAGLGAVTYYFNEYFFKWLATKVVVRIRAELMEHLLHLPVKFFSQARMGDLISRLTNDSNLTFLSIRIFVSEMVLIPFMVTTAIIIAISASWQLSLFLIPFILMVIFPILKLGKLIKRRTRQGLLSLGDTTEVMIQSITGIREVKAFQAEKAEYSRFVRHNNEVMDRQLAVVKTKALGKGLMEFVYAASIGLFFAGGGYLLIIGSWGLTPGSLVTFVAALAAIYRPIRRMAKSVYAFQESLAGAERLFDVLDTPRDEERNDGGRQIQHIEEGIRLEDVSFTYEDESNPVLRGVSFGISKGETVALVGRSGSGKSTIADLIAGFYRPLSGKILVDEENLRNISRDSYLSRIALVSQSPFIFNTTIRDNILYSRQNATEEEMIDAARAANIHDLVCSLPHGYDTTVGERGAKLSGGELQRITIARAILRGADLLIMDEATSSLDAHNEKLVQDAVDRLAEGRTALIIAHRLSTVQKADRIVVLEGGVVRETGTHSELLAHQGIYAELYALQSDTPPGHIGTNRIQRGR